MDKLSHYSILILLFFQYARGDYSCICNYSVEKKVYSHASASSKEIGSMYEFDCKAEAMQSQDPQWLAIEFEHQYGYILKDSNIQIQTCQGNAPGVDRVTTTTTISTTTMTSMTPSTITLSTTKGTQMTSTTTATTTTTPSMSSNATTIGLTTSQPATTTMKTTNKQATATNPQTTTTKQTASTTTSTIPTTSTTLTTATPKVTTATTITMRTTTPSTSSTTASTMPSTATTTRATTTATPKATTAIKTTMRTTAPTTSTSFTTHQPTTHATHPQSGSHGNCRNYMHYAASEHGTIFSVGDKCYELVPTLRSWFDAENDCRHKGGHLAHIGDSSHQQAINNVVQQYHGDQGVWIGLHDLQHEEHFQWTSGDPVTYTNWMPGRKNLFFHGVEDCVGLGVHQYHGRWEDLTCGQKIAYICEFGAVIPTTTSTHIVNTPPSNVLEGNSRLCPYTVQQYASHYNTLLVQHGRSCYELLHNKVTWSHGESLCVKAGGHLVHINTAQEQAYIQALMMKYNPNYAVWIGLHDKNVEGQFQWTAGGSFVDMSLLKGQ
ncbi:aggrecan core protein-like [Mya arenaria]|uniref:aggrecan core protein-like n=1 Tax=Mya arenaria TaxID=6604 RepID=UPI0022E7CDF5|nr:aggrecan core protein-like [Mya arenaria]